MTAFQKRVIAILLALATAHGATATRAAAQASSIPVPSRDTTNGRPTRVMHAVRRLTPVVIDGRLDDPAWSDAAPSGGFTQSYPNPGAPATERTEVRVLYDDDALYVGIRMYDSHPDSVAAQLSRRDAGASFNDRIIVAVDSYHDRRTGFLFSINPLGVALDELISNDRSEDINWDAVWEGAGARDSLGWTAELRLPYSQLRFGSVERGEQRIWGIQVQRDIARRNERDTWSPWRATDPGFMSSAGDLTGIVDIPAPRDIELLPYVSTRLTRAPGDARDPFYQSNKGRASGGVDLKYGLPSGLTVSATVNPDFGQVEADPAVVNLTAFESFFPEKRPFFVEGASIFNLGIQAGPSYGNERLFYSRRIGRAPQRSAEGAFVDAPDASAILGAAKLSGKQGPWTIGVLEAVTGEAHARVIDGAGRQFSSAVEPATNYFVSRFSRDLRDGNSVVSIGATGVDRVLGDSAFTDLLRRDAWVGATDFLHQWANKQWLLSGMLAGSQVRGTRAAITNTQEASAHDLQRPDADYIGVDSARTSLTGYKGAFALHRYGAVSASLSAKFVSPGFEVNDLGFMGRVDYRNVGASVSYSNTEPGRRARDFDFFVGTNHAWNYGGDKIWSSYFASGDVDFTSLWSLSYGLEYDPSAIDDRLTRGGPRGRTPTQYGVNASITSDSRRTVSGTLSANYFPDAAGGYTAGVSQSIDVRPSTSIRVSVAPGLNWVRNTIQYVTTQTDSRAGATYGARYVFGDLHQTTLSASTRIEWTMTPALSLQMYARPFVSAGHFPTFKELAAPGTLRYVTYGVDNGSTISPIHDLATRELTQYLVSPDGSVSAPRFTISNPDFRVASLNGNAVLRWEYRPGSALFFVWQQARSDFVAFRGDFNTARDARSIFTRPTNVFLVKATYWFTR